MLNKKKKQHVQDNDTLRSEIRIILNRMTLF